MFQELIQKHKIHIVSEKEVERDIQPIAFIGIYPQRYVIPFSHRLQLIAGLMNQVIMDRDETYEQFSLNNRS